MAMGTPVIAFDVPNRPRNFALFEPGKEILLYDRTKPEELVAHIEALQRTPSRAREIALAAKMKVQRLHTQEVRVRQVWDWIAGGSQPDFK
jgi:glycosyltransferase involved in cell wall biosynthesis